MKLIQFKHISNWSKKTLIQECLNHNEKAQRFLFETYQAKMFATCMRYLNNEDEGFDVLNEAFLKIFNKLELLEDASKLEAWMKRIVVNSALDHIRKNKKYKNDFVKADNIHNLNHSDDHSDDTSEWWANAIKISQDQLFIEINRLPKATRVVFNLYAIDGLKHHEIAKELAINESTSRWHLSTARTILKVRVKEIINNEIINGQRKQK